MQDLIADLKMSDPNVIYLNKQYRYVPGKAVDVTWINCVWN